MSLTCKLAIAKLNNQISAIRSTTLQATFSDQNTLVLSAATGRLWNGHEAICGLKAAALLNGLLSSVYGGPKCAIPNGQLKLKPPGRPTDTQLKKDFGFSFWGEIIGTMMALGSY